MEVVQSALVGKRLPVDQHPFDSKWKDLMLGCWSLIPEHRPTFHELANEFRVYSKKRASLTKFIEFESVKLDVLESYSL
ncbi:hypothetical protein B9Z55_028012 [Caenorhabditis nigoni]|nr:hypothetical protein B9Z55_028012 [Caenorhabditis nigoni]